MTTCAWCGQTAVGEVAVDKRGLHTAPVCKTHREHFAAQRETRERASSLRRSAAQDARHGRDDVAERKREEAAALDREVRLG